MYTCTFTNPAYIFDGSGVTENVEISSFSLSKEIGRSDVCEITVAYDVASKYYHENLVTNPIQLNSIVELKKDANTIFYGIVVEKPEMVDENGVRSLVVRCGDPLYALSYCLSPYGGSYGWTLSSQIVRLPSTGWMVMVPFKEATPMVYYGSFTQQTLWADPTAVPDMYLSGGADTIVAINDTDVMIELKGSGSDFTTRGFVEIDNEWIYFPTCWYDPVGATWYLGDSSNPDFYCIRGVLGTTAVGHLDDAAVTNKIPEWIAPGDFDLEMEDPPDDYITQNFGAMFGVATKTGCFTYSGDSTGKNFRAYYHVYDSTNDRISVTQVFKQILQGARDEGGAEIEDGDFDISAEFNTQYITRFTCPPEQSALKNIEGFLSALGYISVGEQNAFEALFYYDHANKKYKLLYAPDAAAGPSFTGVSRIQKDMTIDDLYSGVLVKWHSDQSGNELTHARSWHGACGGAGQPEKYRRGYCLNQVWNFKQESEYTSAGNGGLNAVIDWEYETGGTLYGVEDTVIMQHWDADPSGPNDVGHSYWWFTDDAESRTVKKVRIKVGAWRGIYDGKQSIQSSDKKVWVRVIGSTSWDPTNDVTKAAHAYDAAPGEWTTLFKFEVVPGHTRTVDQSTLNGGPWNCIAIVFDYMSGPESTIEYHGILYFLEVETESSRGGYSLVQLTDDTSASSPNYYYAPFAYEKLRYGLGGVGGSGGAPGIPRISVYDVPGGSNEGAAISLGRYYIENSLLLFSERQYEYYGVPTSIPALGELCTVTEDVRSGAALPAAGNFVGETFVNTTNSTLYQWNGASWNSVLADYSPTYTGVVRRMVYSADDIGASSLNFTLFDYSGELIR